MWTIYPQADRAEVESLIARLAAELQIPVPPADGDLVALPPDMGRVRAALEKVEPGWEAKALICPP